MNRRRNKSKARSKSRKRSKTRSKSRRKSKPRKSMLGGVEFNSNAITLVKSDSFGEHKETILVSSGFSSRALADTRAVIKPYEKNYNIYYVKYDEVPVKAAADAAFKSANKDHAEADVYMALAKLLNEKTEEVKLQSHICIGKSAGGAVMQYFIGMNKNCSMLILQAPAAAVISVTDVPIHLAWNRDDQKIPINNMKQRVSDLEHATVTVHIYETGGHEVSVELLAELLSK